MQYTSEKLSKLLADNGCDLESTFYLSATGFLTTTGYIEESPALKSYDILWDVCIKYAKEFFGDGRCCPNCGETKDKDNHYTGDCTDCFTYYLPRWVYHTGRIANKLRRGDRQEAEDYIWENCLFNPKNKSKLSS